jgi:chemotaxis protein CheD
MPELIKVGMADLKAGKSPDSIISYGLGSCVGIALYDPQTKVGGLAHIMLPDSTQARATDNTAKFADTALPVLLDQVIALGGSRNRLTAKIAGGSQMFSFAQATDVMRIGDRNAEAVKAVLKSLSIRLVAEDVGGNYGRTVELLLDSGIFVIKTVNKGENRL